MRTAIIAILLLSGTAAFAQDEVAPPTDTTPPAETPAPAWPEPTAPAPTMAEPMPAPATAIASTGSTQAPGNAAPERDARGIAVVSDAAAVPAGFNGTPGSATGAGGPLVDPANAVAAGEPAATPDAAYPACSRTVTDNCVQAYERGRRR